MYRLNCVLAGTLEYCQNYDTIEDAIVETVTMWPEHDGNPRPMVLDDGDGKPACTFVPIGTNCDAVLVVYCVSGLQQMYTDIHYLEEEGRVTRTSYNLVGQRREFYHKF